MSTAQRRTADSRVQYYQTLDDQATTMATAIGTAQPSRSVHLSTCSYMDTSISSGCANLRLRSAVGYLPRSIDHCA